MSVATPVEGGAAFHRILLKLSGEALMGDKDLERLAQRQLEKGMAFILKPRVRHASGKGSASIGDTVVVEQNGARRLGRREMKLLRAE